MKLHGMVILVVSLIVLSPSRSKAGCQTYRVGINTSSVSGLNGRFSLELTNPGNGPANDDHIEILEYTHDGVVDHATTFGGSEEAGGVIIDPDCYFICGSRSWIYSDIGSRNGIQVDFSELGSYINFKVQYFDEADDSIIPSQFAVYFGSKDLYPIVTTSDPLGVNSFLEISSAASCEEITVFAPATFVPPDSVYIDLSNVTGIGGDSKERGLAILKVGPNPTREGVSLEYVSGPGPILLSIFDVQGRTVFEREDASGGGRSSATWEGRDYRGQRVSQGIYFLQVKNADMAVVRKIVVLR